MRHEPPRCTRRPQALSFLTLQSGQHLPPVRVGLGLLRLALGSGRGHIPYLIEPAFSPQPCRTQGDVLATILLPVMRKLLAFNRSHHLSHQPFFRVDLLPRLLGITLRFLPRIGGAPAIEPFFPLRGGANGRCWFFLLFL